MSNDIRIKNGLSINLKGAPENIVKKASFPKSVSINPLNFHLITPKMVVKVGDKVKMGDVVFYSKKNPEIKFCSPVSGTISDIIRGAKRKILEILIDSDDNQNIKKHKISKIDSCSRNDVLDLLLDSGCWPFIMQRPYDIVANSADTPKAIFVSGINSAPLAADLNYTMNGKQDALAAGFTALTKLTTGKVHVTVSPLADFMPNVDGVSVHKGEGVHPVGLVSTQIAKIDPINKGDKVWTVQIEDVAIIGELFITGKLNLQRIVALTGTGVESPSYVTVTMGAQLSDVLGSNLKGGNYRIISGNVLTGDKKSKEQSLGFYHSQVTVIPEGDDYEFFGFMKKNASDILFSTLLKYI